MRNFLITGGAGFIGSHVAEKINADYPSASITLLDKMTYAADYANISHILDPTRARLVVGDIGDFGLCQNLTKGVDVLIHLAAESHVDNSFGDSLSFTKTNVLGTHTLLEACRLSGVPSVIHVSTDEVYGEILRGAVDESAELHPSNPYSASKAAAEMLIKSYMRSFSLPVIVVRANNIFGTRQFPEKLIPRTCLSLILQKKMPVHGTGRYRRRFLAVEDFAEAVSLIVRKGRVGEAYNIGSDEERENLEVIKMICDEFGVDVEKSIEFVDNRPFNDQRYCISTDKIRSMGWRPKRTLAKELPTIVEWYRDNHHRYVEFSGSSKN